MSCFLVVGIARMEIQTVGLQHIAADQVNVARGIGAHEYLGSPSLPKSEIITRLKYAGTTKLQEEGAVCPEDSQGVSLG